MKRLNPTIALLLWMTASYVVNFAALQGVLRGLGSGFLVLQRPTWMPPFWLFTPLHTVLSGLAGYAIWRAVQHCEERWWAPFLAWLLRGLLFVAWAWLIFSALKLAVSAGVALVLWFTTLATILIFNRRDKRAAWLLLPELGWFGLMTILSVALWRLNP